MECEIIVNMSEGSVVEVFTIIISIVALICSVLQFVYETSRNRSEATIHAFDMLESEDSIIYLFSLSKSDIDLLVDRHIANDPLINDEWNKLSKALPLIEHFAVGINKKIYDKKVLNSMAGNKMISTYNACEELIKFKRTGDGNSKNYSELEKMVQSIKKVRKK